MRAISRIAKVNINTVAKLMIRAGIVYEQFHRETVKNLTCKRIECDELWIFCYSKAKKVKTAKNAPVEAGDLWTWIAIDSDTRLIITCALGDRSAETATKFIGSLKRRGKRFINGVWLESLEK